MTGRLHEIKETTSDAVSIVRELGNPEVQKSLENIRAISAALNDIVSVFKDPQLAKNIENMNMAANSLKESVAMMHQISLELNKAGTLEEVNKTLKSARSVMDSVSQIQSGNGMIASIGTMLVAAKQLIEEARKARGDHHTEQVQQPPLQKKVQRAART